MRICIRVCCTLLSCRIACKILISTPLYFDCTYSVFSLWQPPVQSDKILDLWCVEWRAGDHSIMILWLTLQVAFSLLIRRQRTWWRWHTAKWQVPLSLQSSQSQNLIRYAHIRSHLLRSLPSITILHPVFLFPQSSQLCCDRHQVSTISCV